MLLSGNTDLSRRISLDLPEDSELRFQRLPSS
jgi:hypothetical protein